MAFRPGSRGKGVRRFPGRDGGARKRKQRDWVKQAHHATRSVQDLGAPLARLTYDGDWDKTPEENIYKLDQEVAKAGFQYFAEYLGRWWGFEITVSKQHDATMRRIIGRVEPKRI